MFAPQVYLEPTGCLQNILSSRMPLKPLTMDEWPIQILSMGEGQARDRSKQARGNYQLGDLVQEPPSVLSLLPVAT